MHRQQPPKDPELEALLDERDHLHIQLSLAADDPSPDPDKLRAMSLRLAHLETEIARRWKIPKD